MFFYTFANAKKHTPTTSTSKMSTNSPAINGQAVLPEPTLRRLPWYLAYVSMLADNKIEYVSSTTIARKLNVDPSQIAKDLSFLAIKGKTRIGYDVKDLEHTLEDFLGFKRGHNAVIVGTGSLGAALIGDNGLQRYGLNIVAGFDINPRLIDTTIEGVPVYDISQLAVKRRLYKADIGIVAVPAESAQDVADALVTAGVKALWNFTPYRIVPPEGIVIQNTSIYAHLAVMYNRMNGVTHDLKARGGGKSR